MKHDIVIVGAGFVGAVVAERLASQRGKKVLLIDRRNHIGGNAYDCRSEDGILYHKYGPHIFHTNSQKVVKYLSQFTEWSPYEHRVVGLIEGRLVPIPFNLTSLEILFEKREADQLANLLIRTYGLDQKVPILRMRESEHHTIRNLADYIYQKVFLGYTTKQWGMGPEDLAASVTSRVPVHISYDDRYFQDSFQQMPKDGYTAMFERILKHPKIDIQLETDFSEFKNCKAASKSRMIYTGAIDEFFSYSLGELPYRSLNFKLQTYNQMTHQSVGQVNYPMTEEFTRITEMKHLTNEQVGSKTLVSIEYPTPYIPGSNIPYYPIPKEENNALHKRYVKHASKHAPNVIFAGRLGNYRYYNMDQAIASALKLSDKFAE